MNQEGLTLPEIAVVVALMAILVGLAIPRYQNYLTDRALQNAAHLIQGDLRLAQQTAVARAGTGPRVEMCFRTSGFDIYPVDYVGDPMNRTGAQLGPTLKVANAGEEYRSGIAMIVDATAADACFVDPSRQAIVFSGTGAPISFDDASSKDITLSWNGRTYRITIAPSTGRVTVGQ